MNHIDFIIVKEDWKRNIKNDRFYHWVDIESNYSLVMAKVH